MSHLIPRPRWAGRNASDLCIEPDFEGGIYMHKKPTQVSPEHCTVLSLTITILDIYDHLLQWRSAYIYSQTALIFVRRLHMRVFRDRVF
jgi:hypothetical protein